LNLYRLLRNLSDVESKTLNQFYDALLVVRSQAGDESAFAELVQRYSPRLRYFLSSLVFDRTTVDDELQNVWLDVYRGLARLTDPSAFPAWVYRISRARVALQLRKREPVIEPFPLEEVPNEVEEFRAEQAAAIHRALEMLSTEHREVLVLRFLNDLSYSEIAEVIGTAVGTVRSRLHFAKKALRTILETETSHDTYQSGR
jgi:RNA polymerase sigma-70 factor (ECF subfamily)